MRKLTFLLFISLFAVQQSIAQNAMIRGHVFDEEAGGGMFQALVSIQGTDLEAYCNEDGFFTIPEVPPGNYNLVVTAVGYDSSVQNVELRKNQILQVQFYMNVTNELETTVIDAKAAEKTTKISISKIQISPDQIKKLPSAGGEADLAQYLQIIPGVVFTGDQGGQLYIRGGSPIQTKVLIDGMTVYNPFHSIGFFSVYETDFIKNVEVFTGGFNAEYGDRISAVVDVTMKEGNKKELAGKVSASPFLAKVLLEGPIKKIDIENNNASSISYLLSAKHSYLNKSSEALYDYVDTSGIPYSFTDFYGKLSFNGKRGSKWNLFGFHFGDNVDFASDANFNWKSLGIGSNFTLIPAQRKMVVGGHFAYSDYAMSFEETDERPRTSRVGGFDFGVDFTYFIPKGEVKYGIEITGFETDFNFFNSRDIIIEEKQFTTEIGTFVKYRKQLANERLVIEPSLRAQFYASLPKISPEPRLGLKYNLHPRFRLKASSGFYSQNLLSTKSDRDVVGLFTGFLSGPDDKLLKTNGERANHNLQTAWHAIAGFELDITEFMELNVEPYFKRFSQLIELNRNKLFPSDPNYAVEDGESYGVDFLWQFQNEDWFLWAAYSLGYITRFNGEQEFAPHYDRRHNLNFLAAYSFGETKDWEVSGRWNLGSGFPFTKTQGFYEYIDFLDGIGTDYTTSNGDIGIIYSDVINGGRLPYYHRLDLSAKKSFALGEKIKAELIGSVTNVYNRENIFYFDRVRYSRVNQLPILPSLAFNITF